MKKIRRSAALVLIISLLTSLMLSVTAFAEESPEKLGYVSLGDSISCGYNEAFYENFDLWYTCSEEAYAWQVADAIGAENLCPKGSTLSGARVEEMLILLGEDVPLDDYNSNGGYYDRLMDTVYAYSESTQKAVKEADVITLCVGSNDIACYPMMNSGILELLKDDEIDVKDAAEKVAKAVELMADGYTKFVKYYPQLLARIRELNPDATLVVTGLYNPFRDTTFTDDTFLPIGTACSAMMSILTEQIRNWCKDPAYNAKFVNISDAETWFTCPDCEPNSIYGAGEKFILYIHPTTEGYKYIARQILNALKEALVSTDIHIDLNGIDPVTIESVLVNGIPTKDYTVNGAYELTIHNRSKAVTSVTVTAKDTRKITVVTWQTSFHSDTGYRVYEVSKTEDVLNTLTATAEKAKSTTKKLFGKLTGLLSQ